ncbi:MAG: hypothetical protein EOO73_36080 [Myxococcales bacterium]|nr:MAG: hypothetical protein EOO73_36080 [Myxococcales bacterium]
MNVIFRRTGQRRYAVIVQIPGKSDQAMDPAPGFHPYIPHDLVHYVVEAELKLQAGVFGRAARGGGTFIAGLSGEASALRARERARARRKQARRERALARDEPSDAQMRASERLAYLSDVAWRRSQGQKPDPASAQAPTPLTSEESTRVERVVRRLHELAPRWHGLAVGGQLVFAWPSLDPANL